MQATLQSSHTLDSQNSIEKNMTKDMKRSTKPCGGSADRNIKEKPSTDEDKGFNSQSTISATENGGESVTSSGSKRPATSAVFSKSTEKAMVQSNREGGGFSENDVESGGHRVSRNVSRPRSDSSRSSQNSTAVEYQPQGAERAGDEKGSDEEADESNLGEKHKAKEKNRTERATRNVRQVASVTTIKDPSVNARQDRSKVDRDMSSEFSPTYSDEEGSSMTKEAANSKRKWLESVRNSSDEGDTKGDFASKKEKLRKKVPIADPNLKKKRVKNEDTLQKKIKSSRDLKQLTSSPSFKSAPNPQNASSVWTDERKLLLARETCVQRPYLDKSVWSNISDSLKANSTFSGMDSELLSPTEVQNNFRQLMVEFEKVREGRMDPMTLAPIKKQLYDFLEKTRADMISLINKDSGLGSNGTSQQRVHQQGDQGDSALLSQLIQAQQGNQRRSAMASQHGINGLNVAGIQSQLQSLPASEEHLLNVQRHLMMHQQKRQQQQRRNTQQQRRNTQQQNQQQGPQINLDGALVSLNNLRRDVEQQQMILVKQHVSNLKNCSSDLERYTSVAKFNDATKQLSAKLQEIEALHATTQQREQHGGNQQQQQIIQQLLQQHSLDNQGHHSQYQNKQQREQHPGQGQTNVDQQALAAQQQLELQQKLHELGQNLGAESTATAAVLAQLVNAYNEKKRLELEEMRIFTTRPELLELALQREQNTKLNLTLQFHKEWGGQGHGQQQ